MSYLTDSHFVIGSTHKVCQDYTMTGITPRGIPFIALSDGCSQSIDSDFGARVLVKACPVSIDEINGAITRSIDKAFPIQLFEYSLIRRIESIIHTLDLDTTPFFATLFIAFISNGKLYVYGRGDGTVSIKYRDASGIIKHTITNISYTSVDGGSAPYYLAYKSDVGMHDGYMNKYNLPVTHTHIINDGDGNKSRESIAHDCDTAFIQSIDLTGCVLEHVMISSDGLESYYTLPGKNPITYDEIVQRALAYKNTAAGFVTRRLSRMELEDQTNNIRHSDDVSIATMVEVPDVKR